MKANKNVQAFTKTMTLLYFVRSSWAFKTTAACGDLVDEEGFAFLCGQWLWLCLFLSLSLSVGVGCWVLVWDWVGLILVARLHNCAPLLDDDVQIGSMDVQIEG